MADQTLAQDRSLSAALDKTHSGSVCAVTVTYGKRQHLVRRVLAALLDERDIWKIIVVSNGCAWDVQGLGEKLAPDRIEVIDLRSNRGSAAGFAAGIKRACELGADFIWLLDDDNEPQAGVLAELLVAHARLGNDLSNDNLAVGAFRAGRQRGVAMSGPLRRVKCRPSSFWGFHVFDVPYKLWRRTPWGRHDERLSMPSTVRMTIAPYGGLLFHRNVVERHGLPREDFVVYADDGEFTSRITRSGGEIRLVTSAGITELEDSWHMEKDFGTTFHAWIKGGSDVRVFYGARNHTYLDSHCLVQNKLMYWVNRQTYCLILWLFAVVYHRRARYKVLQSAIRDGLEGRLGVCLEYPL